MRATILPEAIKVFKPSEASLSWAVVSIMAKVCMSTASEAFLMFTTQLFSFFMQL